MTPKLAGTLKRHVAAWALRHLEPELGEWRHCRGTHWRLESINLSLSMHDRSSLELRYAQPVEAVVWPADLLDFIPGDWHVPGQGNHEEARNDQPE